jgi:putative endonuclease
MATDRSVIRPHALGRYGERLAARYLEQRGMVIVDQNWRCRDGEIDLVLRDDDTLVICEVKTRSSDLCGTPHEAISDAKVRRLYRLAAAWLEAHELEPRDVRLDLVAVRRPRRGASTIDYVRGLS